MLFDFGRDISERVLNSMEHVINPRSVPLEVASDLVQGGISSFILPTAINRAIFSFYDNKPEDGYGTLKNFGRRTLIKAGAAFAATTGMAIALSNGISLPEVLWIASNIANGGYEAWQFGRYG